VAPSGSELGIRKVAVSSLGEAAATEGGK